jgi:uncharacterized protein YjbI with pentapeptide repeats
VLCRPGFLGVADFAIDKAAGEPCPNLQPDFRCRIHSRLRPEGFAGCAAYDCFGAGQHVTQVTFGGQDWRRTPLVAAQMFAAFGVVRQLHELLWYLTEALTMTAARPLHDEVRQALDETERLARLGRDELPVLDVATYRRGVYALLLGVSELVRSDDGEPAPDRSGADLIGADLHGADLARANLRGSYLIGANLRGADLRRADLMGTDLRGADLTGADLTGSIFLTQAQLDSARH